MPAITKLPFTFSVNEILISLGGHLENPMLALHRQLSITHGDDESLFSSVGSLYDYQEGEFTRHTSEFTTLNSAFTGTYLESVISIVAEIGKSYDVKIGRIRLLLLPPSTCYSYHRDPEDFRFHIPLITHNDALFINNGSVERMPEVGTLYLFKTREFHTAINGSRSESRLHLVFDTYRKEDQ